MAANATVYLMRPLSVGLIRSAARLARVSGGVGDLLAVVDVGTARVTIRRLPAEELAAHVAGVRSFVTGKCDVEDEGLVSRLDEVQQVLGLVIEPALDAAGKAMELIAGLSRYGHGFAFDGERFRDSSGRVLAVRTAGPDARERAAASGPIATPPDADRVLHRAWALAAVSLRGELEIAHRDGAAAPPDLPDRLAQLRRWLATPGRDREVEPEERALVDAPLGALAADVVFPTTWWRAEGVTVLGWALGVAALPDHEQPSGGAAAATALGFLADDRPPAVKPPRLRSTSEIEWMARRLAGLHWRLRELADRRDPVDFRSFSHNAAFGAFDLVGIGLADDDLAIDGVAITRAPRDRVRQVELIATERLQAIGWLRGLHRRYTKVDPTAT